jgi:DNA-binding NarL/FixJ family response regulator
MLKILVVDDHALVREGLRQVLKGLDESVEILEAAHCDRAFELAALHPDLDLVLLDYQFPGMSGLEALALFGRRHPELPVVMISGSVDRRMVRQVMALGAVGFIAKASLSSELLSILNRVLAGQIYVPPEFLAVDPDLDNPDPAGAPQLTSRQRDVLHLLLDGRSNKEISVALDLSDETVKNHVSAVLRAFGVQTRVQAVLAAAEHGYGRPASTT